MNHAEAIESNAAEGYLLGDLSDAERDAFEEHYFDCRVCTETIRAGAVMFAAGREVAKPKVIPFPVRWIPARAVAAALAVVVGIQAYVIQRGPSTSVLPIQIVTRGPSIAGETRAGESDVVIRFQDGQKTAVSVEIPPEPHYASYRLELRDSAGKSIGVDTVSGAQVRNAEGEAFELLLDPLPAGRYVLVIEGVREDGNRSPVISRSVVVQ